MKYSFYLMALFILCFVACDKADVETSDIPSCVNQEILADTGDWQQIFERRIDGEQFFYLQAGCCDRFNVLFDQDCNQICAPDGGFTGSGDGQCPDFTGAVIEDSLIWERE